MSSVALRVEDLPHYTYEDYVQWEGQWELIRGIPYAMTPSPVIKHQRIITKIIQYLGELLKNCGKCEVLLPVDWQIAEDTIVQPDVLVVCSENENIGIVKLEKTPVMVFEVLSPSTSRKDRTLKYQLYENAGVKYYCIVDPETNSAAVFVLKKEQYQKSGEFKEGKMVFDLGPCQLSLDFREIFILK
jgi:Uma2 family endonuclease